MSDLTRPVVVTTAVTLLAVAALHAAWATGVSWPADDPVSFARSVVGVNGAEELPPAAATAAVAALLLCAAVLLLVRADVLGARVRGLAAAKLPRRLVAVGCGAVAGVLLLRGAGGLAMHVTGWGGETPGEFLSRDLWIYSPLCVAMGLGALLALRGRRT
ncbi:DUF3995 domain-containing protein [Streptosporangium sp. NPDC000396]|uniref:DUF3995 domain-containing protein n=1 Tax=Streptosporangium sp. NPDC000396 TaxID=3366185 RepID=UPI00369FCD18